jgi:hypothetical protein
MNGRLWGAISGNGSSRDQSKQSPGAIGTALSHPATFGGTAGSQVEVVAGVYSGCADTCVNSDAADRPTTGWHFHGHGHIGNSRRQYFGGLPRRFSRIEVGNELISVRTERTAPSSDVLEMEADRLEDSIGILVAVRVVDLLEPGDVDHQRRGPTLGLLQRSRVAEAGE